MASHLAIGGGIKEHESRFALQQRLFDKIQPTGFCQATSAPEILHPPIEEGRRQEAEYSYVSFSTGFNPN
jgi:hypothetical protein